MRLSRKLLTGGAAIGLLAAGTAFAQEQAMRTIQVPANAVVLVLPPGARVLSPGALNASAPSFGFPAPGFGMAPQINAMFEQMDTQMNAMMQAAERGFDMAPTMEPGHTIQAMMGDLPAGGSSVVVTSFSNGAQSCTQRVVYDGNGRAPIVQTSGNGCGVMGRTVTPAVQPDRVVPHQPGLIEASAHRARPFEVAYAGR